MLRSRPLRRSRRRSHHELRLRRLEKGEGGERTLQDWLDRSRLAYLYLDQSPLTIPAAHRAHIKRPDFLVAVDGIGTIAVDAKAKSFIEGCLVLDASERRRLDGFESTFGIPVWYACFPPKEQRRCYLFRNRDLFDGLLIQDPVRQTVRAPIAFGRTVAYTCVSFAHALPPRPSSTSQRPQRDYQGSACNAQPAANRSRCRATASLGDANCLRPTSRA